MIAFLARLVGPRAAKPMLIVLAVLLASALLAIGKCAYDAAVIERSDDKRAADLLPRLRDADDQTITTIGNSTAEIRRDEQETRDAVEAQPVQPLSPRQRARACSVLARQAREAGTRAPAGCDPAAGSGAAAQR